MSQFNAKVILDYTSKFIKLEIYKKNVVIISVYSDSFETLSFAWASIKRTQSLM